MSIVRPIVVATAASLAFWGCATVVSTAPVGDRAVAVEEHDWEGTWLAGGDALTLRVLEPENGSLQVAWIEEEDGELVLRSLEARLLESHGRLFVNLREEEDHDEGQDREQEAPQERWLFALARRDGEELFLWNARTEPFRTLVEEGRLPARLEGDNVVLGPLTAQQLSLVASERVEELFDWEEPMVLRRLAAP